VVWYSNKGFPKGELGQQLQLIYELKLNGLEELIRNIKKRSKTTIKLGLYYSEEKCLKNLNFQIISFSN
jgi:hypothetical protein